MPVAVNDPAGRITAYTYDERGNLISITDPAGYTTSYGYNAQWLPETITDALGKTRHLHYDTLDQLVSFTDCTGETTVHNGQSATVGYRYDPLGNRIRTILPDAGQINIYATTADTCTKSASTAKSLPTSNATNCTAKSTGHRVNSHRLTNSPPSPGVV
ncbi:hypothetical protein [Rothia aeria]|uniref:hypothetical protein n=1 Tax=Rothia aeria TaxID=172042 RepID=UPI0036F23AE1